MSTPIAETEAKRKEEALKDVLDQSENVAVPIPTDPATAQRVQEFLRSKGVDTGTPTELPPTESDDKVEIKPGNDFDQISPQILGEGLVDTKEMAISEDEKSLFLISLLNNMPVTMTVSIFGGQFRVEIRSRTNHEQVRVMHLIREDIRDGIIRPDDPALVDTRGQYYLGAVMVRSINEMVFSELNLTDATKIEQDKVTMRDFVKKNIETMAGVRWNAVLNALRIFDRKCAILNTEAANESFWKPRG